MLIDFGIIYQMRLVILDLFELGAEHMNTFGQAMCYDY